MEKEQIIYEVVIHKKTQKIVKKQQKNIQNTFNKWVTELLPNNPYTENDGIVVSSKRHKLQVYKKRFGMFRALFTIDDNTVIVEVFDLKSRGVAYNKS